MFTTVLVALVLLAAAVAVAYLLLKNMSEEGIEIAAPGSCKRGRCAPQCQSSNEPAEPVEEAPLPAAVVPDRSEPKP